MKPWERRLSDLFVALENCHRTYFAPDLLRMNTNHFLQTARTVTFIVQKNKASIPSFDSWYKDNVTTPWAGDPVMQWAKDARNQIEKEGDLDAHSFVSVTLLFSYLHEQDISLEADRAHLVRASVKKLIRLAQARLPTGVTDASVIRIERRWVANTLSSMELLCALGHIYARLHAACDNLARHLGHRLPADARSPTELQRLGNDAKRTQYLKLSNRRLHEVALHSETIDRDFKPEPRLAAVIERVGVTSKDFNTRESTIEYLSRMAEAIFVEYGHHIPMLHLYDKNWMPIDMLSTHFEDQADKYIFWRGVADRIRTLKAYALAWTSESWIRSAEDAIAQPIRKLPITGERLHITVLDCTGAVRHVLWSIDRQSPESKPSLTRMDDLAELEAGTTFYLLPAMRAFGLPDPPLYDLPNAA